MLFQETEAKVLTGNGTIHSVLPQSLSFQPEARAVLSEVIAFTLVIYGKDSPSWGFLGSSAWLSSRWHGG